MEVKFSMRIVIVFAVFVALLSAQYIYIPTGHSVSQSLLCSDISGSPTAQSCNTVPLFTPQAGDSIMYQTTTANTGDLTVNVNGNALEQRRGDKCLSVEGFWV